MELERGAGQRRIRLGRIGHDLLRDAVTDHQRLGIAPFVGEPRQEPRPEQRHRLVLALAALETKTIGHRLERVAHVCRERITQGVGHE